MDCVCGLLLLELLLLCTLMSCSYDALKVNTSGGHVCVCLCVCGVRHVE